MTQAVRETQSVAVLAPQQFLQRSIPTLERKIDDAIAGKPAHVDLQLAQVQVVDSATLNWILQVLARLDSMNIRLRMLDPSPVMVDVFLATRLDSRLTIVSSAAGGNAAEGANGR